MQWKLSYSPTPNKRNVISSSRGSDALSFWWCKGNFLLTVFKMTTLSLESVIQVAERVTRLYKTEHPGKNWQRVYCSFRTMLQIISPWLVWLLYVTAVFELVDQPPYHPPYSPDLSVISSPKWIHTELRKHIALMTYVYDVLYAVNNLFPNKWNCLIWKNQISIYLDCIKPVIHKKSWNQCIQYFPFLTSFLHI